MRAWVLARLGAPADPADVDACVFAALVDEIEDGLAAIDYGEVTAEDRAAFVECAIVHQVRRALHAGHFDLALELQRWGVRRIARLECGSRPFRPRVIPGGARRIPGDARA